MVKAMLPLTHHRGLWGVGLELVKSYPRNMMRVGNHIYAHGHISPEGRSLVLVEWKASWTPWPVWTLKGTVKSLAAVFSP